MYHCVKEGDVCKNAILKIRDVNKRIAFERVTDRYTDQRTHGGMGWREGKEGGREAEKGYTIGQKHQ